jgi:hypothetical protein
MCEIVEGGRQPTASWIEFRSVDSSKQWKLHERSASRHIGHTCRKLSLLRISASESATHLTVLDVASCNIAPASDPLGRFVSAGVGFTFNNMQSLTQSQAVHGSPQQLAVYHRFGRTGPHRHHHRRHLACAAGASVLAALQRCSMPVDTFAV